MVRTLHPRRWIVVCGAVVGAVILGIQLSRGDSFFRSLGEALAATLGTMIVCGVAARFWQGDDLTSASFPGGGSIGFPEAIEPIETVNRRVDAQMGELEQRVFALEESQEESSQSGAEIKEPKPKGDKQE